MNQMRRFANYRYNLDLPYDVQQPCDRLNGKIGEFAEQIASERSIHFVGSFHYYETQLSYQFQIDKRIIHLNFSADASQRQRRLFSK